MKIAVTYNTDGTVFQHFGHTRYFAVYDVKDGNIAKKQIIDAEDSGHSALGRFLAVNGVSLLICGGIGAGAINVLSEVGIKVIYGAVGSTDEAVKNYLAGHLYSTSAGACGHHSHGETHGQCRGCGHGNGVCG